MLEKIETNLNLVDDKQKQQYWLKEKQKIETSWLEKEEEEQESKYKSTTTSSPYINYHIIDEIIQQSTKI